MRSKFRVSEDKGSLVRKIATNYFLGFSIKPLLYSPMVLGDLGTGNSLKQACLLLRSATNHKNEQRQGLMLKVYRIVTLCFQGPCYCYTRSKSALTEEAEPAEGMVRQSIPWCSLLQVCHKAHQTPVVNMKAPIVGFRV